jgi:hypothetical protein
MKRPETFDEFSEYIECKPEFDEAFLRAFQKFDL